MSTNAPPHRPARRSPLQQRLVLLLLLIGLVPALLVGLLGQQQAARSLEARARADLANLAASVVDKLDRNLFERTGDVRLFAAQAGGAQLDAARLASFMDGALAAYAPMYRLMIVADANGRVRAANTVDNRGQRVATGQLLGRDARDQPWFGAWENLARANEPFVQDLHADPLVAATYGDAGRAVTFSFPILGPNGERLGVWANFFNWEVADSVLADVLKQARGVEGASINLALLDQNGRVLASSDAALAPGALVAASSAARGSDPGETAATIADWRGLMTGYAASQGYGAYKGLGWAAFATQAPSEALAALRTLQFQLAAFGGLVALVVALAATRTAASIAGPIVALTAGTRRAAAGDLGQHVPVAGNDEIGALATSFNQMVDQLRDARATLEQQVEQRTAALSAALADLRASVGERAALADRLKHASIPLVPLTRDVALLTLVGEVGEERLEQLLDAALTGIERERARVLLLDITAVPVVDTAVAGALVQIARGARLLGCELVLVGVRPEVAQTLVGLGTDLDDMQTHGVLEDGLAYALARTDRAAMH